MILSKPVNLERKYEKTKGPERKLLLLQEKLEHEKQLRLLAEKQLELVKALQQATLQGSQFIKLMYSILHQFISFDKAWLYVMKMEHIPSQSVNHDLPRMKLVEICTFYDGFSTTETKS